MFRSAKSGLMCFLIMALFTALILQGCGGGGGGGSTSGGGGSTSGGDGSANPLSGSGSSAMSDTAQIKSIVAQNSSGMFNNDDEQSNDDDIEKSESIAEGDVSPENTKGNVIPHQKWFREYQDSSLDVQTAINGTTADVTVIRRKTGLFHVKPTSASQWITKSIDDTFTKYAQFEKVDGEWKLKAISPFVVKPSSGVTPANITKAVFYNNNVPVLTITDPAKLIPIDQLPVLSPESQIRIETSTSYSGSSSSNPPVFVFFHHGIRLIERLHRRICYDDGGLNPAGGDLTAGDNTYSRIFVTGSGSELYKHGACDCMTSESITTIDDNYSSNLWIVPYKVSPSSTSLPTPTPSVSPSPSPSSSPSPSPSPTPSPSSSPSKMY